MKSFCYQHFIYARHIKRIHKQASKYFENQKKKKKHKFQITFQFVETFLSNRISIFFFYSQLLLLLLPLAWWHLIFHFVLCECCMFYDVCCGPIPCWQSMELFLRINMGAKEWNCCECLCIHKLQSVDLEYIVE